MKKSSVVLLAGLLALSVGGVATASALIVAGPEHATPESGTTEDVLYLEWDTEQSLGQITNLTPANAAYKKVSVKAPRKSANAPAGKFTATLAADETLKESETKTASVAGVTVSIYDAAFKDDGTPGDGANLIGTLTSSQPSAFCVVSTAMVFHFKITIGETEYAQYLNEQALTELAGKISLTYTANTQQ